MFASIFKLVIRGYQLIVSPFFGAACRFYPSCSDYAIESVEHYGILRGILCAARRIGKCHPFSQGGYDPVSAK